MYRAETPRIISHCIFSNSSVTSQMPLGYHGLHGSMSRLYASCPNARNALQTSCDSSQATNTLIAWPPRDHPAGRASYRPSFGSSLTAFQRSLRLHVPPAASQMFLVEKRRTWPIPKNCTSSRCGGHGVSGGLGYRLRPIPVQRRTLQQIAGRFWLFRP